MNKEEEKKTENKTNGTDAIGGRHGRPAGLVEAFFRLDESYAFYSRLMADSEKRTKETVGMNWFELDSESEVFESGASPYRPMSPKEFSIRFLEDADFRNDVLDKIDKKTTASREKK